MTYEWETTLLDAIQAFGGQTPGGQLEEDIRTIFADNPALVTAAIKRIATQYETGSIRSPWGVLRTECAKRSETTLKIATTHDRDKAIARAEQWIRTAGIHYDRETELLDELFTHERNPPGLLSAHDTPPLRTRITELWNELRPQGERVETAALERARNWLTNSPIAKRLRAALKPHVPEHELEYAIPAATLDDDPLPF